MTPKFVVLHHSAVFSAAGSDQYAGINRTHKERFNLPSKLNGSYVGYQYLINNFGQVRQCRADDEIGAHCKENRMNFQSIGICLEGNFDVQKPSDRQVFALRDLLKRLAKKHNIKKEAVMFHTNYAPYKTCPGKNIKRDFIRGIIA